MAACASSCACKGLIAIPSVPLPHVQEEFHPLSAHFRAGRASPRRGRLPATPGSVFLPDRGGSAVVAGELGDKLTAFYFCRETSPKNDDRVFGYPAL